MIFIHVNHETEKHKRIYHKIQIYFILLNIIYLKKKTKSQNITIIHNKKQRKKLIPNINMMQNIKCHRTVHFFLDNWNNST